MNQKRGQSGRHLDQMLVFGLGMIVIFVVVLIVALLTSIRYNNARQEAIRDEYLPRLILAERIRSTVIDQQSSLRGFIITGDETFLEPFYAARQQYERTSAELRKYEPINPEDNALRQQQFHEAEGWYEDAALPKIAARLGEDLTIEDEQIILETSGESIDRFRMANAAYQAALRESIDEATADVDRVQGFIFAGGLAGGVLVTALTGLAIVRILHAIRRPLADLTSVVAAVDAGNTYSRVPALPLVELDALGRGMNRMLDSLASTVREAEVQRSRFATIVESANEGIVVVDASGLVTSINPAAARLFDADPDKVTGWPAAELGFLSSAEIHDGTDTLHDQPIVRRHDDRVLSATISPLRSSDNGENRAGSVWVLRDVTEVARIDQMKNEFISIVSHELRTPLTSIKGFTDLILEGEVGEITEQQREFLKIVQSNSDRLVALINDMLDISRIESGRITLSFDAVDLGEIIDEVVRTLRPLLDEKELNFQTELSDDVSQVIADEARLAQILTNLISNACKYTPDGGWITVATEAVGGQVAVSVSDTGIGIPPDALPQVFSKFYRVDQPAARDVGGTGLGLAITKALVDMHGGRINIASRVGVGTTVRFTLPTPATGLSCNQPSIPSPVRPIPLVLVATPDEAERDAWEAGVESVPALPIHARSATVPAIISEAEIHQPDVIVVRCGPTRDADPQIDDIAEELRANPDLAGTPVIAVGGLEIPGEPADGATLLPPDASTKLVIAAIRDALPPVIRERPQRGRVLVAEDDADSATSLRRVLIASGFEVMVVHDGLSAVVRAIETLPDAVILDVNMPKMGASEVLPQLRNNPGTRDIPIVVMTGDVPDARPFFIEIGASDFFTKPIDAGKLVRRLTQIVRRTHDAHNRRY